MQCELLRGRRLERVCRMCLGVLVMLSALAQAGESGPWDMSALEKAPAANWIETTGKVHKLTYAGPLYQGKPTRVYAVYASPRTLGEKPAGKVPGVVLVHGGGGNAFPQWVELYARRGYAAISMDLAGNEGEGQARKRLEDGGPPQDDQTKFRLENAPDTDQWTYHAVADVVLAHSLLRSLPEVDAERTAVIGISWGGYLTCIVAGVDQRFKAAVPMYGCGYILENSAWVPSHAKQMSPAWREKWTRLWDPSSHVGRATMPMFFVNGDNDPFYPLDSYARTYALVKSPKMMRIERGMKHGHWFDQAEIMHFIDERLKAADPLPRVGPVKIEGGKLSADVTSPAELVEATFYYTAGPHTENKSRPWRSVPLKIDGRRISGEVPADGATAWYVTVRDTRKLMASSEVAVKPM